MFFEEEDNNKKDAFLKKNFGIFSINNLDYNMSFYEVMFDKVYIKWKFHFILIISLLFIFSINNNWIFSLLFLELIIQFSFVKSYDEYLFQSSYYDDVNKLDENNNNNNNNFGLDPFIFLFYDNLGYIIYGVSEVSYLICNEIYSYKNYYGLSSEIIIYNNSNQDNIKKKYIKKNNKYKNLILYKKSFNFYNINLNDLNLVVLKNKNYNINYYLLNNIDNSYSYVDLNQN